MAVAKANEPAPCDRGLALPPAAPNAPALALPAPPDADAQLSSTLASVTLDVHSGDALVLEQLGPVVVNSDGTLSRITNWPTMTEGERQTAKRLIAKRNVKRLEVFREAGSLKEDIVSALDGRSGLRARRDAAAAGVEALT